MSAFSLSPLTMTTKKAKEYISEPIRDKSVASVPGIGPATEKALGPKFSKAYHLLGQFLLLDKDKGKMINWLIINGKMKRKFAQQAVEALWTRRSTWTQTRACKLASGQTIFV